MDRLRLAWMVLLTGGVFGIFFSVLVKLGNPPNMGTCLICFIRDIAGALRLHHVNQVSYLRPEIIGFILGSCIAGLAAREFRAVGGSSPILRFIISAFVAIGALVFLGCPIRAFGRFAGGDTTALVGLLGLVVGAWIGVLFLKSGFTLGRARQSRGANGWVIPVLALFLLVLLLTRPSFIFLSSEGHAPILISSIAGLVVGFLAQRSRLCFVGGIRDVILMRNFHLFQGIIAFVVLCFLVNLLLGQFHPGQHPIAHTNHLPGFLGLLLVGWGSALIGGCPFRQTVLAGYGNADSGMSFLGMLVGAALAHNFLLAGKPSGVSMYGVAATFAGIGVFLVIGLTNRVT